MFARYRTEQIDLICLSNRSNEATGVPICRRLVTSRSSPRLINYFYLSTEKSLAKEIETISEI